MALTQGRHAPSARFRWRQHAPGLTAAGFEVTELLSTVGSYPPANKPARPFWLAASVAENLQRVVRARAYDLCFLQRYLTSTLCTWEPLLKKPFVFDVDDAIFLGKRGWNADRIARSASLIICGNSFLADHFAKHGRVAILPTAVDTRRFKPLRQSLAGRPAIGWSGSSSGLKYVYAIEDALLRVLNRYPDAVLRIVSDKAPNFQKLPPARVQFEQWSAEREVDVLREFSVGLMPLNDSPWERGKCSFKMLTYMAVGVPVVASPVGMNKEVLAQGDCGFAAVSADDWFDAIVSLLGDPTLASGMGAVGREIVETSFSLEVVTPRLAALLKELL